MITIGMVLYNEEKHLSLIEKNAELLCPSGAFQLVLVNNGSTDATSNGIHQIAARWPVVIIERSENHLGRARQDVMEKAQTDWVGYIDGDCVVSEQWIQTVERKVRELPGFVGGFGGPWYPEGAYKDHYNALFASPFGHFSLPQFNSECGDSFAAHIPTANVIYKKSDVIAAGGFRSEFPRVGEDLDLSLRLRASGKKLLMVQHMPVAHYLPESISAWSKKIFVYGRGRVHVAIKNKTFIDRILILPLFFIFTMSAAIILGHVWLPLAYSVVVGVVSFIYRRQSTPLQVGTLIVCTHFSYALGMVYEWSAQGLRSVANKMRNGQPARTELAAVKTAELRKYYLESSDRA